MASSCINVSIILAILHPAATTHFQFIQSLFYFQLLTRSNASRHFLLPGANCEGASCTSGGSGSNIDAVSDYFDARLFTAESMFN